MVFAVFISDGDIITSSIFQHSPRLNMEPYIKCLEESATQEKPTT